MKAWCVTLAVVLSSLLTGCLEVPQQAVKTELGFRGKPDTSAYQSRTYSGDQQAWATAIVARHQRQNEYVRTGLAPAAKP